MFIKCIIQALSGALRARFSFHSIKGETFMRHYLFLAVLPGLIFLLLLYPLSSGGAQTFEWIPAWVDIGDTGTIHIASLDAGVAPKLDSPVSSEASRPEKPVSTGLLGAINQFWSSFTQPIHTPSRATAGWETIFSDDFEGAFPGAWNVFDNDGATNGEYFWAQKGCRPYAGSYSAWAVGGGANGSALACGSNYPNNARAFMVYGPFSLADATDAEFHFMYWVNSEAGYDVLYVGASINGANFYGELTSGSQNWSSRIFDLTDVYGLGDLTGEPQVWVLLAFQSDSSTNFPEGAYVDDILLRKYIADEPTTTPTATSTATPTTTSTPTVGPSSTSTSTPTVGSSSTPTRTATPSPTPTATPIPTDNPVTLPLILRNFPFIPEAPVLNAISNEDGDGNFTITWSSSEGAETYTLQEDDNADFSSPTTVYSGSNTSTSINGRDIGIYYYRVRASNAHASSDWSNVESVTVTVSPPDCPQVGEWSGTTNQGRRISFVVESSPQCQIAANSLRISFRDSCLNEKTMGYLYAIPIVDNSFSFGTSAFGVQGNFTSPTNANGTYWYDTPNWPVPPSRCTASGTWTATP